MQSESQQTSHTIVLADARQARLFQCYFDQHDRLQLTEADTLHNDHEPDREPRQPERAKKTPPRHTPSIGPDETDTRRFARDIGRWARGAAGRRGKAAVLAGPKLLGILRKELSNNGDELELREADLTGLPTPELQDHPEMIRAVRELRREALSQR